MPKTEVLFFREADGRVPVREWLVELRRHDVRAHEKCTARIERLAEAGHELRRPEAAYLRDGIHELRVRSGHVNHRILYCFHGRDVAILAHALTKEGVVPEVDLARALRRKRQLEMDPVKHILEE